MEFLNGSSSSINNTYYYDWCRDYPTAIVVLIIISVICFLLGFPASLVVLHELLRRQNPRTTCNIFMISLTLMDLIFTANIPFSILNLMVLHIEHLKMFCTFVYNLTMAGRLLFMACICADCYVAVCHPIMYKTSEKLNAIKKLVVVFISFFILGFGLVEVTLPWVIASSIVAIPAIMELIVMIFCDISILQALRKPAPTGKGSSSIHPQKKRALYTISSSFILTFVTYLPPVFIFTLKDEFPMTQHEIYCYLIPYGLSIFTTGSVIMPMIHLVTLGKLDTLKSWCRNCS